MNVQNRNINNVFYIFIISHLIIWTVVPSVTNKNLPLDTIEHLAWASNLDWGFPKHPPMVAFFSEFFFKIFGPQDWAFYLMPQIFVVISFYFIFKLANEIFSNQVLSLLSVLILESIFFYNYITPEFNVNICQLPFWTLVVYFSWKIYNSKQIKFFDCFLLGVFSALGFLTKYLFVFILFPIFLFFIYVVFIKKKKKFDFKYLISVEVFLVLLVPHIIWLFNNDFETISYAMKRSGLDEKEIMNHIQYPLIFLLKQIGILIPFFILFWTLIKKFKLRINLNDKKLIFLLFINILPILMMLIVSIIFGSKVRTAWMIPFYLYFGILFIYLFKSYINMQKINSFVYGFLFLFFLSPTLYGFISIVETDKRTDHPGKEIANKIQIAWDSQFSTTINEVIGDEWAGGNLTYHLKSRPEWNGFVTQEKLSKYKNFMCIDDNLCVGSK